MTWERARAQIAADAAALAAAGESAPYGQAAPAAEASAFAAANGARVVECLCEPGATAMQVKVSLGSAVAEARAVLDPSALRPATFAFDDQGLKPQLADALRRLIAAAHGAVRVVSGYRSSDQQNALWERALKAYGNANVADDWVARPGASMHERGLAIDLGGDLNLATRIIARLHLPMWRPLANEPWHFELTGSRRRALRSPP
ncbi:MAG: D-alanyl-D-alanine carboxypeptidase family protein [Actinomycetota bacterium]|nr:D-alanyl-D-alanine carboxypeptidase family protein [Actinomycetota bacterium]